MKNAKKLKPWLLGILLFLTVSGALFHLDMSREPKVQVSRTFPVLQTWGNGFSNVLTGVEFSTDRSFESKDWEFGLFRVRRVYQFTFFQRSGTNWVIDDSLIFAEADKNKLELYFPEITNNWKIQVVTLTKVRFDSIGDELELLVQSNFWSSKELLPPSTEATPPSKSSSSLIF